MAKIIGARVVNNQAISSTLLNALARASYNRFSSGAENMTLQDSTELSYDGGHQIFDQSLGYGPSAAGIARIKVTNDNAYSGDGWRGFHGIQHQLDYKSISNTLRHHILVLPSGNNYAATGKYQCWFYAPSLVDLSANLTRVSFVGDEASNAAQIVKLNAISANIAQMAGGSIRGDNVVITNFTWSTNGNIGTDNLYDPLQVNLPDGQPAMAFLLGWSIAFGNPELAPLDYLDGVDLGVIPSTGGVEVYRRYRMQNTITHVKTWNPYFGLPLQTEVSITLHFCAVYSGTQSGYSPVTFLIGDTAAQRLTKLNQLCINLDSINYQGIINEQEEQLCHSGDQLHGGGEPTWYESHKGTQGKQTYSLPFDPTFLCLNAWGYRRRDPVVGYPAQRINLWPEMSGVSPHMKVGDQFVFDYEWLDGYYDGSYICDYPSFIYANYIVFNMTDALG